MPLPQSMPSSRGRNRGKYLECPGLRDHLQDLIPTSLPFHMAILPTEWIADPEGRQILSRFPGHLSAFRTRIQVPGRQPFRPRRTLFVLIDPPLKVLLSFSMTPVDRTEKRSSGTSMSLTPKWPSARLVALYSHTFMKKANGKQVVEASLRTHEFSRSWAQRSHQTHRTEYFPECLPGVQEIDEMIRQSNRILEGLSRVREVVIAQQTALTEQRARAARGDHLENYGGLHDEYKNYTGGDSKKPRRGVSDHGGLPLYAHSLTIAQKAAPPGRCHSCNRAETPEWRRGPDGARTLCNACGLHYAKLTRKIGVNKAAAMTGSSLRPKNLDQRMTTQL